MPQERVSIVRLSRESARFRQKWRRGVVAHNQRLKSTKLEFTVCGQHFTSSVALLNWDSLHTGVCGMKRREQ